MNVTNNLQQRLKYHFDRLTQPFLQPFIKSFHMSGAYFCPICSNNIRSFHPYGDPPRENALCPVCKSLERHRLDWAFIQKRTTLFDGSTKRMLHIAPEASFTRLFRKVANLDYLSADLEDPRAMIKMDITNIDFADNTFSIIYCSHVLEHVQEDIKAMSEFYRVLKRGGWALLQVPITAEKTFEDPSITDPAERKIYFGQSDHVRRYGPDYINRLQSVGFSAEDLKAGDFLSEAECDKMGFNIDRRVFFCRKP